MKLRTLRYHLAQGLKNLVRNASLSFISIASITLTLSVFSIFFLVIANFNNFISRVETKMEVTVFLDEHVNAETIDDLQSDVSSWTGVSSVEFVSRHKALEIWMKELGEHGRLLDGFTQENNPLPDYLVVSVEKPDHVSYVVHKAQSIDYVEQVNYSIDIVEFVERVAYYFRISALLLLLILISVSMLIIGNTIKMALFARKNEISVMKLVGATDWFIRWPFILEGFILGFAGAILSSFLVLLFYEIIVQLAQNIIIWELGNNMLTLISLTEIFIIVLASNLLIGISVGIIASLVSIHKYLEG